MSMVIDGGVLRLTRPKSFPLPTAISRDSARPQVGETTMPLKPAVICPFCFLQVECKGFGIYPDTPRGDSINMCEGQGTREVFCDYTGTWNYISGECCKCYNKLFTYSLSFCRWLGGCS